MATTTAAPAGSDDFAQPIYLDEQAGSSGSTASSSTPSLDDAAPILNLDDPNLLMADMDTNADVDPYAAPPPLPDGRWQVKVKQLDVKDSQGQPARFAVKQGKDGGVYAYTALECTVVDPSGKFDGIKLHDYFLSTRPQRNGGIPIVRMLTCLKVQLPAKVQAKLLMDELMKALAAEPLVEVDTVWEGGLDQADQERFRASGEREPRVLGQHRFPQTAKGEAIPEMDVETKLGKVHLRARPRINGYFPLGSAKASGMELGPKSR